MFRSHLLLLRSKQQQALFAATSILRCSNDGNSAAAKPWGDSSSSSSASFEFAETNTTTSSSQQKPSSLRPDVESVLEVVRQDAGETAKYYADKYFDGSEVRVNSILWNNLKKFGHVDIDRSVSENSSSENPFYDLGGSSDGSNSSYTNQPRWFPAARFPRRGPRISRYRAEDHDLSLLKEEETAQAEKISNILSSDEISSSTSSSSTATTKKGFPDSPWSNLRASSSSSQTAADGGGSSDDAAPANAGWGELSNTTAAARGRRGSHLHGEARWKRDISKLQRSALMAPKPPKSPWSQ